MLHLSRRGIWPLNCACKLRRESFRWLQSYNFLPANVDLTKKPGGNRFHKTEIFKFVVRRTLGLRMHKKGQLIVPCVYRLLLRDLFNFEPWCNFFSYTCEFSHWASWDWRVRDFQRTARFVILMRYTMIDRQTFSMRELIQLAKIRVPACDFCLCKDKSNFLQTCSQVLKKKLYTNVVRWTFALFVCAVGFHLCLLEILNRMTLLIGWGKSAHLSERTNGSEAFCVQVPPSSFGQESLFNQREDIIPCANMCQLPYPITRTQHPRPMQSGTKNILKRLDLEFI